MKKYYNATCASLMYSEPLVYEKYLITTINGDKFLHEAIKSSPYNVLKNIREKYNTDLIVKDLNGKTVVISVKYIVSLEEQEEQ